MFGRRLQDYDDLFAENLDLLLKLGESTEIHWKGRHRAALTGQSVYPRPYQPKLPIWLGVGGSPESFERAGTLGLPLMVAIIGGTPERFRSLVDLYWQSGKRAGFAEDQLRVGVHAFGYCAETDQQAADEFFPGYADGMNVVGRERGWPPMTRRSFEALIGEQGALAVGSPDTVARKVRRFNEVLSGIARFDFQMSPAALQHDKLLSATRLIGSEVKPRVQGTA